MREFEAENDRLSTEVAVLRREAVELRNLITTSFWIEVVAERDGKSTVAAVTGRWRSGVNEQHRAAHGAARAGRAPEHRVRTLALRHVFRCPNHC